MKAFIETYRGFEISFDTSEEVFYCLSDGWDKDCSKKSYAAIKTWIDTFVKENSEFKPFYIESMPSIFNDKKTLKVVGIRKDGRFIVENKEGKKDQLSEYNEKYYILVDPANDSIWEGLAAIAVEQNLLSEKKKEIESRIIKVTPSDIKSQYIQE
jgi:hypothetical protein